MSNEVKGEGHWSRGLRLKVQISDYGNIVEP